MTAVEAYNKAFETTVNALKMKRYVVYLEGCTFGNFVWAHNKREARQLMTPYAKSIGSRITKVEA